MTKRALLVRATMRISLATILLLTTLPAAVSAQPVEHLTDPVAQALVPNRDAQDTVTLGVTAWF